MTCGVQLSSSSSCHVIHAEVLLIHSKISLSQSLWQAKSDWGGIPEHEGHQMMGCTTVASTSHSASSHWQMRCRRQETCRWQGRQ